MSSTVIDWEYLHSLRDLQPPDEPDIVEELVQMFAGEAVVRGARLQDALGAGNADDIRRVAHMIRGSAGEIGAPSLNALAAQVEASAGRGAVDDEVVTLVGQLRAALSAAVAALEAGDVTA
jgi:HPt (histidine-containing phosphotransfer) domain-containing protein